MVDFSRTRISWRRHPLSYGKVRAALGPIARAWPFRKKPGPGAYLNVGCGTYPLPGFFNIDYDFHPGVDLFWDIRRALPIADRSIGGVFTEHCLEHLSLDNARFAISEFRRVLIPGSVARIVVPDGEIYLRAYAESQPLPYASGDRASGLYSPIVSVNRIFRGSGHLFIYDFDMMAKVLTEAGFHDVTKERFQTGRDPMLLVDRQGRAVESLYVEAVA